MNAPPNHHSGEQQPTPPGDELSAHPEEMFEATSILPLVRLAKSGSQQALGELFGQFRQYLLLIANRNLPTSISPKVGASDLVQETLIQACQIFDRFEGETPEQLRAWLAAILRFKICQARRHFAGTDKRHVGHEIPLAEVSPEHFFNDEQGSNWITQSATRLANLRSAMERLPEDYRLVLELRGSQNLSFAELGARLNRSAEAARKLWTRAVTRLQAELKQGSPGLRRSDHDGWQSSFT